MTPYLAYKDIQYEAIPVAFKERSPELNEFTSCVLSKIPKQLKAYWAKIIFTGFASFVSGATLDCDEAYQGYENKLEYDKDSL